MPEDRGERKNLIHNLDRLLLGSPDRYRYMNEVKGVLIRENVSKLECIEEYGATFNRRITSVCWHPKYPFKYAAGSKFGDITVGEVERSLTDSENVSLKSNAEVEGKGAGGSITAMQFDINEMNILYRTSIDSQVSRIDLNNPSNSLVYFDHDSYEKWFTSMDINFQSKTLVSGDNKGSMFMFNLRDGKSQGTYKLHTNKIHHIEFNKKNPDIFVTAALSMGDQPVKIWDMRKINLNEPLFTLTHNGGVNIATFNPLDGSRLLTTDQKDEIKVFQGPLWNESLIINHHHKQFQHLTPIKANWHPLADMIVVGKYPKNIIDENSKKGKNSKKTTIRTVEFYDANSGQQVAEILTPLNDISSLNVFNPTGEFLASGMGQKLVIWRPSVNFDDLNSKKSEAKSGTLSQSLREKLRGRPAKSTPKAPRKHDRELSPTSDAENEKCPSKTKRLKKAPSTATALSTTSGSTRSKATNKKK